MVSRLKNPKKRPQASEQLNGVTLHHEPVQRSPEYSGEMEQLSISLSKAARSIMEELGTSCPGSTENSDTEVHGGEHPHETIDDVNEVLELGESLSRVSWGSNAMNNRAYYIVDTGHGPIKVKPRKDVEGGKESAERVQGFIDDWVKEVGWFLRQAEVSKRLDQHGEVFDILHYQDDGILQLQFAEPQDLDDDADSDYQPNDENQEEFEDYLGVRRTNNLMYRPVAYFIDKNWYDDLLYKTPRNKLAEFPESTDTLIQHRKRNVLSRDNRGLTLYWPVREEMTWAKKLLANLMRKSSFEAAIGAIRTISEIHTADQVKAYLSSQQSGNANTGSSEKFDFPAAGVVTVPGSVKWEFPKTGEGLQNHVEILLNLLRPCAAGMRLPEFMLTANVSEGNFASTLVSEGPFHKGMKFEQGQMADEDMRIIYQALRWAAEKGIDGITNEDIDRITIEAKMPRVQTRNRKEDFEVNKAQWTDGIISSKTYAASEDRDFDAEQAQKVIEAPNEFPAPLATQKVPTAPGPEGSIKTDPLKEKGVSAGEPTDDPLKE